MVRRWLDPGNGIDPPRQAESAALLPLDELHQPAFEEKYGIPYMEYNFFGPTKIAESLRKIASFFDDTIKENAERVIARHQPVMDAIIAKYRPRLEGKRVMLFVGLRPRHVIGAYEDLGMEIIGAGYEFAHNDDYDRTFKEVQDGALIYDDATSFELESFVERLKPDLIGSGIRRNMCSTRWVFRSGRCTPGITPAPITATTVLPSLPAIWT